MDVGWCTGLESEQELLQRTKDEGSGRKGHLSLNVTSSSTVLIVSLGS